MAGTTLSDYLDRTAGLGYFGGAALLSGLLVYLLRTTSGPSTTAVGVTSVCVPTAKPGPSR